MAVLNQEGINRFFYVETASNTWQMGGCVNSISESESTNPITVQCDSNGTDPITEYGTSTFNVTLGGVYFVYSTEEESTNYSVEDFRAARAAKTKLKIRIGDGTSAGKKGQEYQDCVISSIDVSSQNGQNSTYSIQLSAKARVPYTVA